MVAETLEQKPQMTTDHDGPLQVKKITLRHSMFKIVSNEFYPDSEITG